MSVERPKFPTYFVIPAASLRMRAGEPGPRGRRMLLWVPVRPSGPSGMTILEGLGTLSDQISLSGEASRHE